MPEAQRLAARSRSLALYSKPNLTQRRGSRRVLPNAAGSDAGEEWHCQHQLRRAAYLGGEQCDVCVCGTDRGWRASEREGERGRQTMDNQPHCEGFFHRVASPVVK